MSFQSEIEYIHKNSDGRDWIYDDNHKNYDESYKIG